MRKYISSVLFVIAALLWGLAFTAQKKADILSAFTVGAVRNIMATAFLLLVIPLLDRLTKNGRKLISKRRPLDFTKTELIGGAICGTILTAASAFQQTGIAMDTDAGKAAFITALYVLIVPIIYQLFGRHSGLIVWISVGISIVGFYLLCVSESFTILPSDALVLICAVIFALHIIAIDRFSPRCDGVRMSCVQFFTAFILNSVLALIFEGPIRFDLIGASLPSLLYLGICSSGIAYTLQIVGQRDADPTIAPIILSLESVFGVVGGAIILRETMSLREYLGCAIVFAAVVLSQLDIRAIAGRIREKKNKKSVAAKADKLKNAQKSD